MQKSSLAEVRRVEGDSFEWDQKEEELEELKRTLDTMKDNIADLESVLQEKQVNVHLEVFLKYSTSLCTGTS